MPSAATKSSHCLAFLYTRAAGAAREKRQLKYEAEKTKVFFRARSYIFDPLVLRRVKMNYGQTRGRFK